MSNRPIVVTFIVFAAALFFVSGFREVKPEVLWAWSGGPICGPVTDEYGNLVGDAGPCPSRDPNEPTSGVIPAQWGWAPFWVPRQEPIVYPFECDPDGCYTTVYPPSP